MFKSLWNLITGNIDDSAAVLDHIPVNRYEPEAHQVPPKPVGTTMQEAKARHGKQFKAYALVERETPPSRDLQEMNELSAQKAQKVVQPIRKKS